MCLIRDFLSHSLLRLKLWQVLLVIMSKATVPRGARPRKPRPKTIAFVPEVLYNEWEPLARKPLWGWSWDCKEYSKSRDASPDEFTLRRFAVPLTSLLTLCPSGFPAQANLAHTLAMLQKNMKVFGQLTAPQAHKTCADAAELWRTMCKHVYNLSKEKIWPTRVNNLCAIIIHPPKPSSSTAMGSNSALPDTQLDSALPDTQPGSALPDTIPDTLSPQEVDDMWPKHDVDADDISDDSGSVELLDVKCNCSECTGVAAITITSDGDGDDGEGGGDGDQRIETVKTESQRRRWRPARKFPIKLPVKISHRIHGGWQQCKGYPETYITMKSEAFRGKFRYLVGQSARSSPHHSANIAKVIKKIEKGEIKDNWAAKDFLHKLP